VVTVTRAQHRLAYRLGHSFDQPELLVRALTHRSADACNNERLEFLGDAILAFLVGEHLFDTYSDASEGKLTRLRSRVVRRESLADAARKLGVGDALILGAGEQKTRGRERDSILAGAFEALVGALYLDSDFATCRDRTRVLLDEWFEAASLDDGGKDAKTRLQERLQARAKSLPEYRIVEVGGAAHCQSFIVSCRVDGLDENTTGTGTSRRRAEQNAAKRMMAILDELDD
jgi:ribonuclease-3